MRDLKPSLIPVVLDKLVEIARGACVSADPDRPIAVLDGPERDDDINRDTVIIGWTGMPDTQSVEAQLNDAGPSAKQEVIDVHCMASVISGDDGQKATRDRAFAEVLDPLAAAIHADHSLGRTVTRAHLRVAAVEPFVGTGAGTTVMFTIHVEGPR